MHLDSATKLVCLTFFALFLHFIMCVMGKNIIGLYVTMGGSKRGCIQILRCQYQCFYQKGSKPN